MDDFRKAVEALLRKQGLKGFALEVPPKGVRADLALPCFPLAGRLKKDPKRIAEELAGKIKPSRGGLVGRVEALGPYVNFHADWSKLGQTTLASALRQKERFGAGKPKKEKLMVEFAHPNTHKAFHIGHVRNICLGESLSRVLEFSGYKIARVNYQGDIGPHVAKCIWGYINLYEGKAPGKDRGLWLGKVYAEASRKAADSDKVREEIREINKALYAGDRKLRKILEETKRWSMEYFDSVYDDFGVEFDRLYFESEVEGPGVKLAKDLLKRRTAKLSEGAIVMDLEKHGLGVWILLTRDGTPLYSIKDFILAGLQDKEFRPSRIIHVVGSEQNLHFRQLIKSLEITAPKIAKKEHHLVYELVNLESGKMASRLGKVITYEDVKGKLLEKALEETKLRNPELGKAELGKIAEKIALGALKYGMLRTTPSKTIIFDWDRALSLDGNTGPYVLYSLMRTGSILRKAKNPGRFDAGELKEEKEIALLKTIARFPLVVENAAREYRPHYVLNYMYEISNQFNDFYESVRVLQAEHGPREARLALVKAVNIVLRNGLRLLAIEPPQRM